MDADRRPTPASEIWRRRKRLIVAVVVTAVALGLATHNQAVSKPGLPTQIRADVDGDGRPDTAALVSRPLASGSTDETLVVDLARGGQLTFSFGPQVAQAFYFELARNLNGVPGVELVIHSYHISTFDTATIVTLDGPKLVRAGRFDYNSSPSDGYEAGYRCETVDLATAIVAYSFNQRPDGRWDRRAIVSRWFGSTLRAGRSSRSAPLRGLPPTAQVGEHCADYSPPGPPRRYVALGDSYSSGEGAVDRSGDPSFLPGTDAKSNRCHRSVNAYPFLVKRGASVIRSRFVFKACSGAIMADFVARLGQEGQWTDGRQLDDLARSSTPDASVTLVTLSVGGNDAGFPAVLPQCVSGFLHWHFSAEKHCVAFARDELKKGVRLLTEGGYIVVHPADGSWSFCTDLCQRTGGRPAPRSSGIAVHVPTLAGLYEQIHGRAPRAQIHVLLYPHLFGANPPAKCTVGRFHSRLGLTYQYTITRGSAKELNALGDELDNAIASQVRIAAAAGVDIRAEDARPSFAGHGLCDLHEQWLNPIVWGRFLKDVSAFSFHPTARGQRAFAAVMGR